MAHQIPQICPACASGCRPIAGTPQGLVLGPGPSQQFSIKYSLGNMSADIIPSPPPRCLAPDMIERLKSRGANLGGGGHGTARGCSKNACYVSPFSKTGGDTRLRNQGPGGQVSSVRRTPVCNCAAKTKASSRVGRDGCAGRPGRCGFGG